MHVWFFSEGREGSAPRLPASGGLPAFLALYMRPTSPLNPSLPSGSHGIVPVPTCVCPELSNFRCF